MLGPDKNLKDLGFETGDIVVTEDNRSFFIRGSADLELITNNPLEDPLQGGNWYDELVKQKTRLQKMASVAMAGSVPPDLNHEAYFDWLVDISTRTNYEFVTENEIEKIRSLIEPAQKDREMLALVKGLVITIAKRLPKLKGITYIDMTTGTKILATNDHAWDALEFSGVVIEKGPECKMRWDVGDHLINSFPSIDFIPTTVSHYAEPKRQGKY